MDIIFLTLSEVLMIHQSQIELFGGHNRLRDRNLLESAISMPQATFSESYMHSDIFEMAAAYMFHIIRNHPFLDGNKRTGTVAAITFLAMNDLELDIDQNDLVDFVLSVAQSKADKPAIAQFLRKYEIR